MADSPRLSALKQLSSQIPVANSRIAQQQKAGRDLQLQQAVARAPAGAGVQQAQQAGAQQAAQAGQQTLDTQQTGMQQQGQVAQVAAQGQQQEQQSQQFGLEQGLESQKLDNVQKFANLSEAAKKEMFDSRMQFQKDENGREFLNERQLADYAKLTAKSADEFKNYAQQAEQAHTMQLQALETINKRLEMAMKNEASRKEEGLDMLNTREIAQMKSEVEARIQRENARAANRQSAWQAGGTIVGGVIGILGGPAGVAAGASIGGAAGGAVGSATA